MWGWSKHQTERATAASWTSWRTREPRPTVTDPDFRTEQPETTPGRTETRTAAQPAAVAPERVGVAELTEAGSAGVAVSAGDEASPNAATPTDCRISADEDVAYASAQGNPEDGRPSDPAPPGRGPSPRTAGPRTRPVRQHFRTTPVDLHDAMTTEP